MHAAKWLGLPGLVLVDLAPAKDSLKGMGSSNPNFPPDGEPFSFRDWAEGLAASALSESAKDMFRREILGFLHACKSSHAPATVAFAKQYLGNREAARAPLRWFFSRGAMVSAPTIAIAVAPPRRLEVPPPAAADLGGSDWERVTIRALREKGLLWRTEQTYRAWGAQFAEFIRPRSVTTADEREVGAFLSHLAVSQRASRSTQRQALNAIVFILREALGRQLGQIPFKRSQRGAKVPTVLSRDEMRGLCDQLSGTTRLMAELAYGSGLRLMEKPRRARSCAKAMRVTHH